jgi:hypothetical protein
MSTTNIHKISGDIDVAGEIKKNGVTIDTDDIVFSSVNEIAIGTQAGETTQGANAVAIGTQAGETTQGANAVAIGAEAGQTTQGVNAVAIGNQAGETSQSGNSVAVGRLAGQTNQDINCVAVGGQAGNTDQGQYATAVGYETGLTDQGNFSTAVGSAAGKTSQAIGAVAVGRKAGETSQGASSVAIGNQAGTTSQPDNSIILNATGSAFNPTTASSFHVKPVRGGNFAASALAYTADGEIVEETGTHFDANGNVGIGTTEPARPLEIARGGGGAIINLKRTDVGTGQGGLAFVNSFSNVSASIAASRSGTEGGVLQFYTAPNDTTQTSDNPYQIPERMRIDADGNVGIGTTDPDVKLELFQEIGTENLYDAATLKFSTTNNTADWDVGSIRGAVKLNNGATSNYPGGLVFATKAPGSASASLVDRMVIDANGNVGIGKTNPDYALDVVGDIQASGNVTAYSDRRLKSNIRRIESALDKVRALNGYTFTMNEKSSTGLIAQEILPILPEAVTGSEDTNYAVAYGNMMGLIVEAIKELEQKIG